MNGMGGGWWMGAGSLVVLALIALIVVLSVKQPDQTRDSTRTRSAEEILAARFANGEIDEVEYRGRLNALRR